MSGVQFPYILYIGSNAGSIETTLNFTYLYQQPARYTFEQPKLKAWTEKWCKGAVLNLFAGKIRLKANEYRVDISDEFKPDCVSDCQEFVEKTDKKFDTVIFDPPYNWRKSREKYGEGKYIGNEKKLKDVLPRVLNNGGGRNFFRL